MYKYLDLPKKGVAVADQRQGVNSLDKRLLACAEECKLLSVTGVLTLDEENRYIYFCDQCALHK